MRRARSWRGIKDLAPGPIPHITCDHIRREPYRSRAGYLCLRRLVASVPPHDLVRGGRLGHCTSRRGMGRPRRYPPDRIRKTPVMAQASAQAA